MKKIIVIFISLFIISCKNNSVDKIEFKQQDSCFCKTSILGIFNLKLGMSKDSVLKLINNPKKEFDKHIETAMGQLDILFAKKEKEISN
jgi:hypothetical protein